MTLDIYAALHDFNSGVSQALHSLEGLAKCEAFNAEEVTRFMEFVRESQSATNSYLLNVILEAETDEAGALYRLRRDRERREE